MKIDLTGQTALVTGASRGIGQAIALCLAQAGAVVIGTATSQSGADAISQALSAVGGRGVALDVTDVAATEAAFAELIVAQGGLHILVNNAGITRDTLSMRMKNEDWDAVIDTNLSAVFRLSKLAMKPMMKQRGGRIINISSVVATMGNAGQANYCAAKAGLEGMTRALARELGSRNITVNAVAPGFIATDMTKSLPDDVNTAMLAQIPLSRFGQPEDIAHAVAFLASSHAAYITGTTMHINGGMAM